MVSPMTEGVLARLAEIPPFDRLDPGTRSTLADRIHIRYVEPDEVVFEMKTETQAAFFVVHKGLIALSRGEALVELCDEGDIFGIRALLTEARYSATARAKEDSLLYAVPWAVFSPLLASHAELTRFFAAGFAAELPAARVRLMKAAEAVRQSRVSDDGQRTVPPVRNVLTCSPDAKVMDAARAMTQRGVGSIVVVDTDGRPVGILTDTDLRKRVVAVGLDARKTRIDQVMTAPVSTLSEPQTVTDLVELVMQYGLHHFVFTQDGTARTPVIGVASEHDLTLAHSGHPTVLRQKLLRSDDPAELKNLRNQAEGLLIQYLDGGTGMPFVARVMTGMNDALIHSAIRLAHRALSEERPPPEVPFCWLSFGSEGRMEQLLRTDIDQAIV